MILDPSKPLLAWRSGSEARAISGAGITVSTSWLDSPSGIEWTAHFLPDLDRINGTEQPISGPPLEVGRQLPHASPETARVLLERHSGYRVRWVTDAPNLPLAEYRLAYKPTFHEMIGARVSSEPSGGGAPVDDLGRVRPVTLWKEALRVVPWRLLFTNDGTLQWVEGPPKVRDAQELDQDVAIAAEEYRRRPHGYAARAALRIWGATSEYDKKRRTSTVRSWKRRYPEHFETPAHD